MGLILAVFLSGEDFPLISDNGLAQGVLFGLNRFKMPSLSNSGFRLLRPFFRIRKA
jgi:hypothetical protein